MVIEQTTGEVGMVAILANPAPFYVFGIIILLEHNIAWNQIVMPDCRPQEVFQNQSAHVLIHYTFNSMPNSRSKSCHTTSNHNCPPPCFTVSWTCCGCTSSPSVIRHHDLSLELNMLIFVSSLKMTRFQS